MNNPYYMEIPIAPKSGPFRGILSTLYAGDIGPSWERSNSARLRFLYDLGIAPERVVNLRQEHTRQVLTAAEVKRDSSVFRGDSSVFRGDGLVTADRELVLAVTVADCLPIFLHDCKTGAFGIVHSGWKGTGIVLEAMQRMTERYGTHAGDVHAAIGPGIGACCYRVDESRAGIFAGEFGKGPVQERDGGHYLDLKEANRDLLERAGVRSLYVSRECTACTPWLGSYRRQGQASFVRMIALIGFF